MDFEKFLSQDLSVIKQELNVDFLKQKDDNGYTIIVDLFYYSNSLKLVKYVFKFCKIYQKTLFLEKSNFNNTILNHLFSCSHDSVSVTKYVFKFCILNCPYLFLQKNFIGKIFLSILIYSRYITPKIKYGLKFSSLNFPEISIHTNNFILPLMMEIQN